MRADRVGSLITTRLSPPEAIVGNGRWSTRFILGRASCTCGNSRRARRNTSDDSVDGARERIADYTVILMATPILAPEKEPTLHVMLTAILRIYMRLYHRMDVEIHPESPKKAPYIALTSHFSMLDPLALIAMDPFTPKSTTVCKASLFDLQVLGGIMRSRGIVPVSRDGRDIGPLRNLLSALKYNRGICLAAEGRRSRTGRLGPINRVVVKLAARAARGGIPVFPVAVIGTFESLPPGSRWPRPRKLSGVVGKPIDLQRWKTGGKGEQDLAELARVLQESIAALLPSDNRPAADTPALALPAIDNFDA